MILDYSDRQWTFNVDHDVLDVVSRSEATSIGEVTSYVGELLVKGSYAYLVCDQIAAVIFLGMDKKFDKV
jgi:hypothetical protein